MREIVKPTYPGIPPLFLENIRKSVFAFGYDFHSFSLRGALFENSDDQSAILIDYRICDFSFPFSYTEYTKEQNAYMHEFRSFYRFPVDNDIELEHAMEQLNKIHKEDFSVERIRTGGSNRELIEIDPTLPEASFERFF